MSNPSGGIIIRTLIERHDITEPERKKLRDIAYRNDQAGGRLNWLDRRYVAKIVRRLLA